MSKLGEIIESVDWNGEHSNHAGRSIGRKQAKQQVKELFLEQIDQVFQGYFDNGETQDAMDATENRLRQKVEEL